MSEQGVGNLTERMSHAGEQRDGQSDCAKMRRHRRRQILRLPHFLQQLHITQISIRKCQLETNRAESRQKIRRTRDLKRPVGIYISDHR